MERIEKEFKSGEILHAGEMNYLVACINKAIETINKSVSSIAPAVKRDVKVVNMHIKTHGGTGTIFSIPAATEQYAGVVVVDDKISKDSKNPVQNKVLSEALGKLSETLGAWKYGGKVSSHSDINSSASLGSVYLSEDDGCVYVVTYKEDFTDLYVTIAGHTYTVDTTKAVSVDDLSKAMTESHPFEGKGFETMPFTIGNSYAQLVPVLTDGGYTIALCSTDATAEDGVAIVRILNQSTYSSMNSAEMERENDDQRYNLFNGDELPEDSLLIRPFGANVDKLALATRDYVDRMIAGGGSSEGGSILYEEVIEGHETSLKAPTTKAVADYVKPDEALSGTSKRAVENRAVKNAIDNLLLWHV